MIRDSRQGFEIHDGNLCFHEPFHDKIKKIKINGITSGSVTFKQYGCYLNTLNTELC